MPPKKMFGQERQARLRVRGWIGAVAFGIVSAAFVIFVIYYSVLG
jgi:hypothetical protein